MTRPGRMTRLLGIDPGLRFTGWGLIEVDGNRLRHLADGGMATVLLATDTRLDREVALKVMRPDLAADETFVSIAHASPRPSMGGGAVVEDHGDTAGRAYHFRRSWIRNSLKASPSQLRIMHVEGDSMAPTLLSGDAVLVDMTRRAPNPPGIFVLDDGMGLVAKRLEHIPNSDPPAVRVISDNKHYPEYERTADEIHIVGRIRWFAREI